MSGASLDAILPLKVDGSYGLDDLHRTDVLMASLNAFFEPDLLSTFLIVSPAQRCVRSRTICPNGLHCPLR